MANAIARSQIHFQDRFAFARLHTDVPELQDVEGPKSIVPPPPLTVQTTGPKWTIFQRETPLGNPLSGTVAIFEFPTTSQDT